MPTGILATSAHGYLLHSFLSPLSNRRTDDYGGSLNNRVRLLTEVAEHVRGVMRDDMPLLVRISATDWVDGGWGLDESVTLSRQLARAGVDLIKIGHGNSPKEKPACDVNGCEFGQNCR